MSTSYNVSIQFSSVQSLSRVQLFLTPWTEALQASLSITNSRSLIKLMSIESVMPSNHLIFCCPLLLPPSIFPSIGIFSNESVLHIRSSKYWSFSFSVNPSNEYSELISFRMDWLDLLAVQRTPNSLLQHYTVHPLFTWGLTSFKYSSFFTWAILVSFMNQGAQIALIIPLEIRDYWLKIYWHCPSCGIKGRKVSICQKAQSKTKKKQNSLGFFWLLIHQAARFTSASSWAV